MVSFIEKLFVTPWGYFVLLFIFRFLSEMCNGVGLVLAPKFPLFALFFISIGKALGALGFGSPDQTKPFGVIKRV